MTPKIPMPPMPSMPPQTPIEELLARARLLDEPLIPRDVVPVVPGVTTAQLFPGRDPGDAWPSPPLPATPGTGRRGRSRTSTMAARDLRTLCETVLAHTTPDALQGFVTEQLPEPPGARVLGCVLQLADAEDGARSWWQYAAGAGDDLASYCLYLHHLMLGDTQAAAWWREQTKIATRPAPEPLLAVPDPGIPTSYDASFPTVLRALTHLDRTATPRTELVDAVMHYVPGAVALGQLDPDFELPLPGPDFAEHLSVLLAAASTAATWMEPPTPRRTAPRLPRLPRREARGTEVAEG